MALPAGRTPPHGPGPEGSARSLEPPCLLTLVLCGLLAILLARPALAGERELEEAPAPKSVEEIEGPFKMTFERPPRKLPLFPRLSAALDRLPPFLADTQLEARYRTYYLRQDRTTDVLSEAWAMGGSIYYHSGWLKDFAAAEIEGFTSQPIVAPDSTDGTLLLKPGQKGYGVLGVANGKLRYKGLQLTGFRQTLDLPYMNRQDNRMTPNTFEAITLARSDGELRFSTGWVARIKRRNDDDFDTMSEAVGVSRDRGLAYGGVLWQPHDYFYAGAVTGIVPDLNSTTYAETGYTRALRDSVGLRVGGQFTYQTSVGDELLPDSPFDTWNLGIQTSASSRGAVARLGFAVTGDERAIFSPYGSNPSYANLMQRTFTREDEKALLASLSFDFSGIGADGLSAITNFVAAWDGRLDGVRRNGQEIDLTLDYRAPAWTKGLFLKGLWLRLRGSWLHEDRSPRDGYDVRVILRYDFPVV